MKITQDHLDAARLIGACKSHIVRYKAGDDIASVSVSDLAWVENKNPELAGQIAAEIGAPNKLLFGTLPLWSYSRKEGRGYSGDGYGRGYGNGGGDEVAREKFSKK